MAPRARRPWWANFNVAGPEIEYFRPFVAAGQPALDVACGAGRLLVPWVESSLDVDGVDASADMVAACRDAARKVGRNPGLYVQPVHRLDLDRRYGAIVMCGASGSAGRATRTWKGCDGCSLTCGRAVGWSSTTRSRTGISSGRARRRAAAGPPAPSQRRLGSDGFEYALRHESSRSIGGRSVDGPRAEGLAVAGRRARRPRDDQLVSNVWSPAEIVDALAEAGFEDIQVVGGYHGGPPAGDERFLVYLARHP